MSVSGILTECLHIEKTNYRGATHFILCNGEKIRYIIDLNGGKSQLGRNIKSYSGKLCLLMKLMSMLPLQILQTGKMGYFAKVVPCEAVQRNLLKTGTKHWNVIVGTYDEKQKLVFQCFADGRKTQYVKVGNQKAETEMQTEINYLRANHSDCDFVVPKLVGYELRSENCPLNIQITEEFGGEKVEPVLTEEIVKLYQSICKGDPKFSHGDFAPWNIRKDGERYIVFDWEHCGERIEGYDIAYFVTVMGVALEHKSVDQALEEGISEIRKYLSDFTIDRKKFKEEFCNTVRELTEKD